MPNIFFVSEGVADGQVGGDDVAGMRVFRLVLEEANGYD